MSEAAERLARLTDRLADFYRMLDTIEVVGRPRRHHEIAELDRLIELYPDTARKLMDHADATKELPPGRTTP
jgi:hypothetical protein